MTRSWRRLGALVALLLLLAPASAIAQDTEPEAAPAAPLPPEVAQPAYEVFRIDDGGIGRAYRVWEEWVPQIATTPDGVAVRATVLYS